MCAGQFLTGVGSALYGERWRKPLAVDLGVNTRTVQRWAAGESPIPPVAWATLVERLGEHTDALASMREQCLVRAVTLPRRTERPSPEADPA